MCRLQPGVRSVIDASRVFGTTFAHWFDYGSYLRFHREERFQVSTSKRLEWQRISTNTNTVTVNRNDLLVAQDFVGFNLTFPFSLRLTAFQLFVDIRNQWSRLMVHQSLLKEAFATL